MSAITPFDFHGRQVRVLTAEDGEPRFVLNDLCTVLNLGSPHKVAARIDEDARTQIPVTDSLGRQQQTTVVDEAGMYEVILRSDKPEAVEFRRWVTREVLPAIRKHGGYLTEQKIEQVLTDPDTIIRLATDLKDERARRVQVERKNVALDKWKRATEAGDGLKLSDFRGKYFTSVPKMAFFQHLYDKHWMKDERGWRKRDDGTVKEGPNHMAPLRKANGILYQHGEGNYGGKQRLQTRVKPDAEIAFRDALIKEGLTPNEHSTGLVLITNEDLKELGA
ncbi:BRO-N domain-containing protein [Corynebacterium nuruki]|uniref:BRO-N domain-containing protein n=1 Tax=Corynebacterium nuruki TaxID=1032851 RepID=UPI0002485E49|nr:Bro-N domain-containing protein [Corynebacterium nuruki]